MLELINSPAELAQVFDRLLKTPEGQAAQKSYQAERTTERFEILKARESEISSEQRKYAVATKEGDSLSKAEAAAFDVYQKAAQAAADARRRADGASLAIDLADMRARQTLLALGGAALDETIRKLQLRRSNLLGSATPFTRVRSIGLARVDAETGYGISESTQAAVERCVTWVAKLTAMEFERIAPQEIEQACAQALTETNWRAE